MGEILNLVSKSRGHVACTVVTAAEIHCGAANGVGLMTAFTAHMNL